MDRRKLNLHGSGHQRKRASSICTASPRADSLAAAAQLDFPFWLGPGREGKKKGMMPPGALFRGGQARAEVICCWEVPGGSVCFSRRPAEVTNSVSALFAHW